MNESVKKWLEEKRAELAGRRDVAIFIRPERDRWPMKFI